MYFLYCYRKVNEILILDRLDYHIHWLLLYLQTEWYCNEESVLDIICNLYPNIHPSSYDCNPILHPYQYLLNDGTIPFSMDDLCHTFPRALIRVLSIAIIYGLTKPSETNRCPIVVILSLISIEMVFSLLSKVRLMVVIILIIHKPSSPFCCMVNQLKDN